MARQVVESQLDHNMTFQDAVQKLTSLGVRFEILVTKGSPSYSKSRTNGWYTGRFPFGQKFRKFRFGAKWTTFSPFAQLENSQKKWNCSEGSPVFPVGTCQWKFVFHLQNFSSLSPVPCLSRSLSGHASLGSLMFPVLIRVRFLEAFCKQTSGLLRLLCLPRSSNKSWKFIAVRMCLI